MSDLRCEVTGHPCGTDTRMVGHPCECQACRVHVEREEDRAAILDLAHAMSFHAKSCYVCKRALKNGAAAIARAGAKG
jgi:hypothetical protein